MYISSISGAIAVLRETAGDAGSPLDKFELEVMLPSQPELGEIYSMDVDDKHILTGKHFQIDAYKIDAYKIDAYKIDSTEGIVDIVKRAFALAATTTIADNSGLTVFPL